MSEGEREEWKKMRLGKKEEFGNQGHIEERGFILRATGSFSKVLGKIEVW